MTIDEIAADIAGKLRLPDRQKLKRCSLEEARGYHHGFGTWIRNEYGLWDTSPLTVRWREDPSCRKVVNGVDESPDHPDQVSDLIIQRVWRIVQESDK
jgi:hypothetical protein